MADTTAVTGLANGLEQLGVKPRIQIYPDLASLSAALLDGRVDAISGDGAMLTPLAHKLQQEGVDMRLLSRTLSEEPLSVVLPENQSSLQDLVNSVIQILSTAADLGVTQSSVATAAAVARSESGSYQLKQLFGLGEQSALTDIKLTPERIEQIIASVGNLRELLSRQLSDPPLIEHTLVRLPSRPL